MKKITQINKIFLRLASGKTITPMQALDWYGCNRLAARICELRDEGTSIDTTLIHKNGKSFAQYGLEV